ncbi:MAG: ligand-binding sensor domain-containing diguanylate cyclase [Candidatus Wenzhouxiangella sp. M2_3B_020]
MHEFEHQSLLIRGGPPELDVEPPDPEPLRWGCLLVYAGLLLTLAMLFAGPAAGEPPYRTVQHWDVEDGLEQNTVQAIARDSTGYLWLGTVDGLSRFDGARFRNFRLIDYPALGSNRIRALESTRDGSVWIGTAYSGLARYRDGRFETLPLCERSCRIFDIAAGAGDDLWVLSSRGLDRVDTDEMRATLHVPLGPESAHAGHLRALDDGRVVYAVLDRFIVRDAAGVLIEEHVVEAGDRLRGIVPFGGALVVATSDAVLAWRPTAGFERIDALPESVRAGRQRVRRLDGGFNKLMIETSSGDVYIADLEGRVQRLDVGMDIWVMEVMTAEDGTFWIGTRRNGLIRLSPSRLFGSSGYRNRDLGSVLPIIDHPVEGVLVGRLCGGITHIDAEGRARPLQPGGTALERCIWTMLLDEDGSVLVGSYDGAVQRLVDGEIENLRREDGGRDRIGANFLIRDAVGRAWLGSDSGLFRIDGNRLVRQDDSPESLPLLSAARTPEGLLIGTAAGLVEFDGERFETLRTGKWLDSLPVRAIHRQDERTTWFGTYGGGLWRRRGDEWFQAGPDHGLIEDVVSCMLVDDRDRLWTSGNHGITQVELADLNALADGRRESVNAWALTEDDGMPDSETNGGGQPACHRDRRGWFWFPTVAGPVAFDPETIGRFRPTGRLSVESVRLDGRQLETAGGIELPDDARNLEIRYTVPQFENAHRLRFRYRLAGIDDRWVGAGSNRSVEFPIVPTGKYRFEVQLGIDDGRWLDETASVSLGRPEPGIRVEPWQLALVTAGLAVLLVFFRLRIGALRRRDAQLKSIIDRRTRKLRETNARLDELSRTDELTGIANQRRLRFYIAEQWRACMSEEAPLTLIVIDVDRFKAYNDALGHPAGDRFLRAMAQSLSRRVRAEGGLLARYGGEEFVAVLPRRTGAEGIDIAESLRLAVVSLEFERPEAGNGFVTASFGVASMVPCGGADAATLVQQADRAMYRAKQAGRDRVEFAEDGS